MYIPRYMYNFCALTGSGGNDKPVVLVYFIGGCTYAEIAALRFLASRREDGETLVCGSHPVQHLLYMNMHSSCVCVHPVYCTYVCTYLICT